MLCENPYYAVYLDGRRIFISKEESESIKPTDNETIIPDWHAKNVKEILKSYPVQRFPCRECLMCRWESSNEWSLRCKLAPFR